MSSRGGVILLTLSTLGVYASVRSTTNAPGTGNGSAALPGLSRDGPGSRCVGVHSSSTTGGRVVVATISRLTSDTGVEYLTGAVATGTHDYYTGSGEAAGVWSGGGLARLGLSGEVTADQMEALFVHALDPRSTTFVRNNRGGLRLGGVTPPVALGAPYRSPTAASVGSGSAGRRSTSRVGVAGFDVQFAPSKSVSVVWALATPEVRRTIEEAHDAAVSVAFAHFEEHALFSRAGRGGIRQIDAEGFIVARFRHRTNRDGHPQLHTHCAVLNRVWTVDSNGEGKWRTIDGRGLYRELHAAGTVYARAFEQQLSATIGLRFEPSDKPHFREIAGVPKGLARKWSRRDGIEAVYERLAIDWFTAHGCAPTGAQVRQLWTQATLQTRKRKAGGVRDLHGRWEVEAGTTAVNQIRQLTTTRRGIVELVASGGEHAAAIAATIDALQHHRAQFNRAQITVIAAAHLPAGPGPIRARLERFVDAVLADPELVALTPPTTDLAVPGVVRRSSGESQYDPHGHRRWSTVTILAAEQRLLDATLDHTAPTLDPIAVAWHIEHAEAVTGRVLDADQRAAVDALTVGGHRVVTIIGPAGAGKTALLRPVVDAYRAAGREVIGLALSQQATNVLAADSGARCENITKWLHQHHHSGGDDVDDPGRWRFHPGQLVIVDEAAMAATLDLDRIVALAQHAGARVALIGDDMQLGSPEAGGLVRELAHQPGGIHLHTIHRFTNPWEAAASLALRSGDTTAASDYQQHGRLIPATTDTVTAAVVTAWHDHTATGADVVMIADTNNQAAELSRMARALLVATGVVAAGGVELHDGNQAGVGDRIQTRLNDRRLTFGRGRFVSNRDTFTITDITPSGALAVTHTATGDRVILPAGYVAEHVELAYAGTVASTQGRTVDTAFTVVTPGTDRASLYVAMTRGRHTNIAHVITDGHDHNEFRTGTLTVVDAFAAAVARDNLERSATATINARGETLAELTGRRDDVAHQAADIALHAWLDHLSAQAPGVDDNERRRLQHTLAGLVGTHDLADALTAIEPSARDGGPLDDALRRWRYRAPVGHTNAESTPWMPAAADQLITYAAALDASIDQRREQLISNVHQLANIPEWAQPITGAAFSVNDAIRRVQQDIIAVAAVYREQHAIDTTTKPLGPAPTNTNSHHYRDWLHTNNTINQLARTIASYPDIGRQPLAGRRSLDDQHQAQLEHARQARDREQAAR